MKKKFDKGAQMVIQKEIVKQSFLEEGQELPLVIKPNVSGLDLNQWYLNNKDMVEEKILKYGGVLFRGFDTTTPESFYGFIDVSCPEPLSYKEGATPRTQVQGKVYTSTEFPNEESIAPHNELSYVMTWPKKSGSPVSLSLMKEEKHLLWMYGKYITSLIRTFGMFLQRKAGCWFETTELDSDRPGSMFSTRSPRTRSSNIAWTTTWLANGMRMEH